MFSKSLTKCASSVFAVLCLAFAVGCGLSSDGDDGVSRQLLEDTQYTIGGYVFDVSTGAKLTSYTVKVELADKTLTGSVNATTGKYTVSGLRLTDDYQITVTATGYNTFTSTNNQIRNAASGANLEVVDNRRTDLMSVPMIPTTLQTAAVEVNIYDRDTGAPVAVSGYYKLYTNGATAPNGLNTVESNGFQYGQDQDVITGTFTNGTLNITAGTLLYGYSYTIDVYNVAGYNTGTGTVTPVSSSFNSNVPVSISLTPMNAYQSLQLLSSSNEDSVNSVLFPLNSDRKVTYYFNQDIELDPNWSKVTNSTEYLDGSNFITSINTSDTNGDDKMNVLNTTDGTADTVVTPWLTSVSVTGNKLEVVIAADSILLSTDDSADDLSYELNTAAIAVRPIGTDDDWLWWPLSTWGAEGTLLIRDSADD